MWVPLEKAHTSVAMVLHYGDLTDSTNLAKIVNEVRPTEVYNLGAMSHVKVCAAARGGG